MTRLIKFAYPCKVYLYLDALKEWSGGQNVLSGHSSQRHALIGYGTRVAPGPGRCWPAVVARESPACYLAGWWGQAKLGLSCKHSSWAL